MRGAHLWRGCQHLGFYRRVAHQLPHPRKIATGGEDAYFSHVGVQAIFDGVSWWKDKALVDAGLYSAALARSMFDNINDDFLGDVPTCYPNPSLGLLQNAYDHCRTAAVGTSTALVASLLGNQLYVANVGDCTLLIARKGEIILKTEEQVHDVDFPYQLGTGSTDTPANADLYQCEVKAGDVVIMGSDGIFDNVYVADIVNRILHNCAPVLQMVEMYQSSCPPALAEQAIGCLNAAAYEILHQATAAANDIHSNTPYASRCIENGAYFEGGKLDDMTLLISFIGLEDEAGTGERFVENRIMCPPPYRGWP